MISRVWSININTARCTIVYILYISSVYDCMIVNKYDNEHAYKSIELFLSFCRETLIVNSL